MVVNIEKKVDILKLYSIILYLILYYLLLYNIWKITDPVKFNEIDHPC